MPDQFIGKYRIENELGRGAMGVVFRALDPSIDRPVAIKVIRTPAFSSHEETAQLRLRLMQEARAAGRLSHPNIVTIHALEEHDDFLYVVMECVEGQSLEQHIASRNLSEPSVAIPVLRQIAEALDYAHGKGIIHRDIKPANVLIDESGRVKLTDFGIAKITAQTITATGMTMGTPAYMPLEQIRAEPLDGRADQYSLAVMAYEIMTGQLPFEAPSHEALVLKIANETPRAPHEVASACPRPCTAVLLKALSKQREERYASCSAFVSALETSGSPRPVPSPRVTVVEKHQTTIAGQDEDQRNGRPPEKSFRPKAAPPATPPLAKSAVRAPSAISVPWYAKKMTFGVLAMFLFSCAVAAVTLGIIVIECVEIIVAKHLANPFDDFDWFAGTSVALLLVVGFVASRVLAHKTKVFRATLARTKNHERP